MKEPSLKSFLVRVGGLAVIFYLAIYITNNYFPDYQSIIVFSIAGVVLLIAGINSFLKRKSKNR